VSACKQTLLRRRTIYRSIPCCDCTVVQLRFSTRTAPLATILRDAPKLYNPLPAARRFHFRFAQNSRNTLRYVDPAGWRRSQAYWRGRHLHGCAPCVQCRRTGRQVDAQFTRRDLRMSNTSSRLLIGPHARQPLQLIDPFLLGLAFDHLGRMAPEYRDCAPARIGDERVSLANSGRPPTSTNLTYCPSLPTATMMWPSVAARFDMARYSDARCPSAPAPCRWPDNCCPCWLASHCTSSKAMSMYCPSPLRSRWVSAAMIAIVAYMPVIKSQSRRGLLRAAAGSASRSPVIDMKPPMPCTMKS